MQAIRTEFEIARFGDEDNVEQFLRHNHADYVNAALFSNPETLKDRLQRMFQDSVSHIQNTRQALSRIACQQSYLYSRISTSDLLPPLHN